MSGVESGGVEWREMRDRKRERQTSLCLPGAFSVQMGGLSEGAAGAREADLSRALQHH